MNLNALIAGYEPLLARLITESDGSMYRGFYLQPNPEVELSIEQSRQFNLVYLIGILERSHLASITFLARSHRWLNSCRTAIETSNILGFAASLRGFLESAADGFDVMRYLPETLYQSFEHIYALLHEPHVKDIPQIAMGEMEERLIHYAFATRQPKGPCLPHHRAHSQAEYIREFEKAGVPDVGRLYEDLCSLTHPSSESVNCFLLEGDHLVSFTAQHDDKSIEIFLRKYEECITNMFQHSLNPPLIALAYLRRLNSDWIGPRDVELSTIGAVKGKLAKIDEFTNRRRQRSVAQTSLQRKLNSLVSSMGA
jgi:hypothetical protein